VPFLRHARDKRGYETTFVMHNFRGSSGQQPGQTRLLYMFRTPSNRKIGRRLLDPEVMEALEHTHPDLTFDWTSMLRTPMPPAPPGPDEPRRDRRRDRNARNARGERGEAGERGEPGERRGRGDRWSGRSEAAPAAEAPLAILEDETLLGKVAGAAEAARLRTTYAELVQRIARRARTPEERDRLSERAQRLNPDEWADESAIREGRTRFAEETEALRQELPRRRRGRRGGRARDRAGDEGSAIIEGHAHDVELPDATDDGGGEPGLDRGLGAEPGAEPDPESPAGDPFHERD
jgi:hypothetical protein